MERGGWRIKKEKKKKKRKKRKERARALQMGLGLMGVDWHVRSARCRRVTSAVSLRLEVRSFGTETPGDGQTRDNTALTGDTHAAGPQ